MNAAIIASIVSLIVGGGLTKLFSVKTEKRSLDAKALSLEIENLRTVLSEVRMQSEIDRKSFSEERQFLKKDRDALRDEVGVLRTTVLQLNEKIDDVTLKFEKAEALKCLNISCEHRDPPIYDFKINVESEDKPIKQNNKNNKRNKKK